jgi:hypothetical protein
MNFRISKKDMKLIQSCVDRVVRDCGPLTITRLDMFMYIAGAHSDRRLNLDRLLASPAAQFFHDVGGIMGSLDRTTGKLQKCFEPLCGFRK